MEPELGEKSISTDVLWDEIGFHKPIAGFWFNITYTIIGLFISITVVGYLMGFFYPWPESFGYKDIVFGYFTLLWVLFDTGTLAVMGRFIPESNINDPQKMMHFIQYFIWYQMITGLIQTTVVSVYAIFYAPHGSMAYTIWIMLVAATTQYPGFLHVFKNVLESLQHFNKSQTLNFLTSTIVQRISELFFVYMGRLYGEANPHIGPILGIAIGASIGLYVDDFLAMVVSMVFFNKVMNTYGITPKKCFYIQFSWEEIKPVIIFSIKIGLPGIIGAGLNFVNLLLWLTFLPQYTTLLIMAAIGGSIADVMNWFGIINIGPPVAESYMNGKEKLTQYYIGQLLRFNSLIVGFFVPIILTILVVIPDAWIEFGMVNYLPGLLFIIPRLIRIAILRFSSAVDPVIPAADRPNVAMVLGLISNGLQTLLLYLYLVVLNLPVHLGLDGIAWLMELGMLPIWVIFGLITYIYIHKRIVAIVIPWKQMLLGMVIPSIVTYFCLSFLLTGIYIPVSRAIGVIPGIAASVPILALILIFVYFPLTALLGGWDAINLEEFEKAAVMSGPSKFLVMPLYRVVKYFSQKSPLHDRFGMDATEVIKEAKELYVEKLKNREVLRENIEE